jgi:hypothetical protein
MAERSDDGARTGQRSSGQKPMAAAVAAARTELEALLGHRVERVSGATPEGEGWRMTVDAVELARVPDSTSVLGSYEVLVDGRGHIVEYQRTRRFYRNRADEEEW